MKTARWLACALPLVVAVGNDLRHAALADSNWPSFRGPNASGVSDGQPLPSLWDAATGKNIAWKTAIPGLAHSSPVIWGDRIFVTTAVPSDGELKLKVGLYGAGDSADDVVSHAFKVLCVDKRSGAILWEQTAFEGAPRFKRHTKATHANPTPATDGRFVVASFGSEGLYCYTVEGGLVWKKDLGPLDVGPWNAPELQWGFASSPIIHDGAVFHQCDVKDGGFLVALDLQDGRERWRTPREDVPGWCTPSVLTTPAGTQIVCNGCKHMGGFDAATGKEIWRMAGGGGIPVPAPVVAKGLIFLTSNHQPIRDQDPPKPIFAVRQDATGVLEAGGSPPATPHLAWLKTGRGAYMQTPLVYGEHLYVGNDNGIVTCYDALHGETVWRERVGSGSTGFTASAVAGDGKVYYADEQGDVHVLRAGERYERLALNSLGEICLATPAISDGRIYFRTQKHLLAVGPGAP